jgi:hypothetical protein
MKIAAPAILAAVHASEVGGYAGHLTMMARAQVDT